MSQEPVDRRGRAFPPPKQTPQSCAAKTAEKNSFMQGSYGRESAPSWPGPVFDFKKNCPTFPPPASQKYGSIPTCNGQTFSLSSVILQLGEWHVAVVIIFASSRLFYGNKQKSASPYCYNHHVYHRHENVSLPRFAPNSHDWHVLVARVNCYWHTGEKPLNGQCRWCRDGKWLQQGQGRISHGQNLVV